MEVSDKRDVILITLLIDFFLLYIVIRRYQRLKRIELTYIYLVFISHAILYLSIYYSFNKIIDLLHYLLLIFLILGIIIKDSLLLLLIVLILNLIQILWVIKGRCILNTDRETLFGYSKSLNVISIIYLSILSFKLGIVNIRS